MDEVEWESRLPPTRLHGMCYSHHPSPICNSNIKPPLWTPLRSPLRQLMVCRSLPIIRFLIFTSKNTGKPYTFFGQNIALHCVKCSSAVVCMKSNPSIKRVVCSHIFSIQFGKVQQKPCIEKSTLGSSELLQSAD